MSGKLKNTTCPFVQICNATLENACPTSWRNKIREVIPDMSTQVVIDSLEMRNQSSPAPEATISSQGDVVLTPSTSVVTKLNPGETAVDGNAPDSRLIDVVLVVEAGDAVVTESVQSGEMINPVSTQAIHDATIWL